VRGVAWLRLALVLVGLGISAYLTAVHYHGAPLYCRTRGIVDCEQVVTSPESVVLGLPLALWGVVWFVLAGVLAWPREPWEERVRSWRRLWAAVGALAVVYFVYLEFVVIGHVCLWCSAVHLIVLVLLALEVAPAAA
jgi:uncharacterized membrane protein